MTVKEQIKEFKDYFESQAERIIVDGLGLQRVGLKYRCPNTSAHSHGDKNPSMSWYKEGQCLKCFGCDTVIDLYGYYKNYKGLSHKEIMGLKGQQWGEDSALKDFEGVIVRSAEENEEKKVKPSRSFKLDALKDFQKDYLYKRGLSDLVIDYFKLGNVKGNIGFPYILNGQITGIKLKNMSQNGPKYKSVTGSEMMLLNRDNLKPDETLYITEGEVDCLSLAEATNIFNVASIGNGAASLNKLFQAEGEYLESFKEIVVIGDRDEKGEEMNQSFHRKFGSKCKFVDYELFKGHKDINEVLLKEGPEHVKTIMASAKGRELNELDELKSTIYGNFYYSGEAIIAEVVVKKGNNEEVKNIPIFSGFITITGSIVDLDEEQGIEYLKIISYFHNIRKELLIRKAFIANENKLLETLNNSNGILIKSRNKKLMVEYLEEQFEGKLMDEKIPSIYMTKNVGFFKYRKNGLNIKTFIYPNSKMPIDKDYQYNPDEIFNEVFIHAGTMSEWIVEVYDRVKENRNAFISIVGAFASILLEPLGVPENFLIDISGSTSTGKSTLLKITSSIYGKPSKMISDFNATSNSIISRAVALKNFPLFLDDSKKADKTIIGDVIYTLSGGKEKGRSTITGDARAIREFNNITFTNGEVAATEYLSESSSNGRGAYSRLLPLEGGFLKNSQENAEVVNKLLESVSRLYGAIGYEWIQFIYSEIQDPDKLKFWREAYESYKTDNAELLSSDIARRRGVHIALLQVTYEIMLKFNAALGCKTSEDHFEKLIAMTDKDADETDNYKMAHEHLMEKFKENAYKFIKIDDETYFNEEPYNLREVWGECREDQYLVLSYETISKLIRTFGDARDILKKWKELGVMETDKNQYKKTIRIKYRDQEVRGKRYVINTKYDQEEIFEKVDSTLNPFD